MDRQILSRNKNTKKIIVSIAAESLKELLEMIKLTDPLNVLAIEPNLTCPNDVFCMDNWMSNEAVFIEVLENLCKNSRHPIVLKLSAQQDYAGIAAKLKNKVSAVSINSVPWKIIFPEKNLPWNVLEEEASPEKLQERSLGKWPFPSPVLWKFRLSFPASGKWKILKS